MMYGSRVSALPREAVAKPSATAALLLLCLAGAPAAVASATRSNGPTDQLVGTWQGRSLCVTTTRPACTDETVVYRIRRSKPHVEAFTIQADKIVAGKAENMGDIACRFEPVRQQLLCPMQGGQWRFRWDGSALVGVLTDPDGSLVRVIQLHKAPPGADHS